MKSKSLMSSRGSILRWNGGSRSRLRCWYRMGGWTSYGQIFDKYLTFVQSLSNICQISVHVQFLSKFCDECLNFVNTCLHWTQIKMSTCPIFHMLDKPWTNFCPIYDQDLSCSALAWKLLACPIFIKILTVSKVCTNPVKQKFLFGFYLLNPCQCPKFVKNVDVQMASNWDSRLC